MLITRRIAACGVLLTALAAQSYGSDIETLRNVGAKSEGTAKAQAARDALVAGGANNLLPLLKAFSDSSLLAENWLRSTFETIADSEIKAGRSLPKGDLLDFVRDTSQAPSARRLAYEWLLKRTPELEAELIPQMLLDPSPEFRRDAVAQLLKTAESQTAEAQKETLQRALKGAVHEDQVKTISSQLKDAGTAVNIQQHFGFLPSWKIIGPFDNKDMKGYAVSYPPEEEINLEEEYEGQLGEVAWQPISSDDDFGIINIAEDIENHKGSLMYATTVFQSGTQQDAQIRLGTPNAWKLWVNDKLVFEREEYHRSTRMDQYKIPVTLKAGPNVILLKVCQNEQDQPWAQKYQFQLRISDSTGAAIRAAEKSAQAAPEQGQLR